VQGDGRLLCGGVVLSPRLALTAAHCVAGAERVLVAGAVTTVVAVSQELDVAVLRPDHGFASSGGGKGGDPPTECGVVVALQSRAETVDWTLTPASAGPILGSKILVTTREKYFCMGDSGSALLACDGTQCSLLGLLRAGSSLCRGSDIFTAWDAIYAWLDGLRLYPGDDPS